MKEKTYKVRIVCGNCNNAMTTKVPHGMFWEDHFKDKDCKNCGCALIQEEVKEQTEEDKINIEQAKIFGKTDEEEPKMHQTICDRCGNVVEGNISKRGGKDMCGKCGADYDKFMDKKEEKKGFL